MAPLHHSAQYCVAQCVETNTILLGGLSHRHLRLWGKLPDLVRPFRLRIYQVI